jgi:hypothetical protein
MALYDHAKIAFFILNMITSQPLNTIFPLKNFLFIEFYIKKKKIKKK